MTTYLFVASPVGRLFLAADEGGLRTLAFMDPEPPSVLDRTWREGENDVLRRACVQLEEYFTRRRRRFDLPLAPSGTEFQLAVWSELERIPYGETISYGDLAARIGRPRAVRAVGAANGRNPIAIIVPCHRVIGADGSLTGFGGGLPRKRLLLELESSAVTGDLFASLQDCRAEDAANSSQCM